MYTDEDLFRVVIDLIGVLFTKEEDEETDRFPLPQPHHRDHFHKGRAYRREKTLQVARARAMKDSDCEGEVQNGRYFKKKSWLDQSRRDDRLDNNSPTWWFYKGVTLHKQAAASEHADLDLREYYRETWGIPAPQKTML